MFAPRPPLPITSFSFCFTPPTFHKFTLSVSLSVFWIPSPPPFPPPSFHPSLFLYSHGYLDCMPQRRTKWLASLFLCSLFAVNVMFVLPEGKTNKQTNKNHWLGSNLELRFLFATVWLPYFQKHIDIYFLLNSSSYWPDPYFYRTNCRCKKLSDRIGTEPVWSTCGLVSQRDSLIVCRGFFYSSWPLSPQLFAVLFGGAGRRWGNLEKVFPAEDVSPTGANPD